LVDEDSTCSDSEVHSIVEYLNAMPYQILKNPRTIIERKFNVKGNFATCVSLQYRVEDCRQGGHVKNRNVWIEIDKL
jgi:hypothetical protein